jgi:hypothetical protein
VVHNIHDRSAVAARPFLGTGRSFGSGVVVVSEA